MRASSPPAIAQPASDLRALRQALIASWPALLVELLGKPSRRSPQQWRWNRHGSLSAVMSGSKAGTWFDHEAGSGGGPFEIIARARGGDWRDAADWARRWLGLAMWEASSAAVLPAAPTASIPAATASPAPDPAAEWEAQRRRFAQRAACNAWEGAGPADPEHPYLQRKGVLPHGVRMEVGEVLLVPLGDIDGTIHTLQRIYADGSKRFLAGGAKAGHFALLGSALAEASTTLVCEGWATAATAHEATGLPVVAAMDAGNVKRVAPILRQRFPTMDLVFLADNDAKPGRLDNPGLAAATAAAQAVDGRLAVPPEPGDANDLAARHGLAAVRQMIAEAAPVPPPAPSYLRAVLSVGSSRTLLEGELGELIDAVAQHWARCDAAQEAANDQAPALAGALPPPWAVAAAGSQATAC